MDDTIFAAAEGGASLGFALSEGCEQQEARVLLKDHPKCGLDRERCECCVSSLRANVHSIDRLPSVLTPTAGTALIIDRANSGRDQFLRGFLRRGFDVVACDTHSAGLTTAAETTKLDLVVVEVELLGSDWVSAFGELRTALPKAQLVVCTTRGSVSAAVRAVRAGATSFLIKPVTADQVLLDLDLLNDDHANDLEHPTYHRAVWEYVIQCREAAASVAEASRRLGLAPRSLRRMLRRSPPAR